jgi:hypothetical protein
VDRPCIRRQAAAGDDARRSGAGTASETRGRDIFFDRPGTDIVAACNGCHTTDPAQGLFGTGGETTFENEPQQFKVAHLRNAYQKVGMFGMPDVPFLDVPAGSRGFQGDQVRVSSPSKDDLQGAMRLLKTQDFGVELQFGNYRE